MHLNVKFLKFLFLTGGLFAALITGCKKSTTSDPSFSAEEITRVNNAVDTIMTHMNIPGNHSYGYTFDHGDVANREPGHSLF